MRLYVTFPVLLLTVGCQTTASGPVANNTMRPVGGMATVARASTTTGADGGPLLGPAALAGGTTMNGGPSAPIRPATPPVSSPQMYPPSPPGDLFADRRSGPVVPASYQPTSVVQTVNVPAPAPCMTAGGQVAANVVPARVQTTTTYCHHFNLGMDWLSFPMPFPHLKITMGPDKVITQTEYARVPAAPQPYPAPNAPVVPPPAQPLSAAVSEAPRTARATAVWSPAMSLPPSVDSPLTPPARAWQPEPSTGRMMVLPPPTQ